MLEVPVVLVVLKELVVFVGGIFENWENYRNQEENFWCKKRSKNP